MKKFKEKLVKCATEFARLLGFYTNILQTEAEELSGFKNRACNPRPQASCCMRGVKPDNFECLGL